MATTEVDRQTLMRGDRLDAYRAQLEANAQTNALNERLELARFQDRVLTDAEWSPLEEALKVLGGLPLNDQVYLMKLWPEVVHSLSRNRFRVLESPPQGHTMIEYATMGDGIFALCSGNMQNGRARAAAINIVHSEACGLAIRRGLGLDHTTFAYVTNTYLTVAEPFKLFKAAMALYSAQVISEQIPKDDAGVKRAVDTAWALARQIVEPQLQALASSQFCRRDPFYVPTGDFAGVRVTREMIERLLLGDTLSLLMS
jgi:hypothetical protein